MSNLIPMYDTKTFTEIYDTVDKFLMDYHGVGIPTTITEQSATTLFYLLYSRYGNNPIANHDETQFKYKVFSTIFMYGPTWEKRLDMQSVIRNLSISDLQVGLSINRTSSGTVDITGSNEGSQETTGTNTNTTTGTNIGNHAYNPGTLPSTQTLQELEYIDQQNVTKDNKSGTSNESATLSSTGSNTRKDVTSGNSSEVHTKGILDAYNELWKLLDNDVTNDFLKKFIPLFKRFVRPEKTLIFESEE